MNQYNSYYLYQQYEKRGNQDWLPSYPNIFSVDGDGTMPLVMKKENDPDCGYTGDTEPIYRWYPLPITTDYICDECPYYKLVAEYSDSSTFTKECSSNTTLTSSDTHPTGYTYSAMTTASIGGCINSIGDGAFSGCTSLTSVTIPDSVTSIGNEAFRFCIYLRTVSIPNSITIIENEVFSNCYGITSVTIPNGVTRIDNEAFYYCTGLASVTIPNSVTRIGSDVFAYCGSLTSIVIPDSVTRIGSGAFRNCSSLTSVTVNATTPPTLGTNAFNNNASGRKIYVPSASVETYKAAWSQYASDIEPKP